MPLFSPGLTVDLSALTANWHNLRAKSETAECAAVVKANAYGLGAIEVTRALMQAGCQHFFVATLDEALALRTQFPTLTLYVLHGVPEGRASEFATQRITPVLSTESDLARFRGQAAPCWVQMDTGMNRLGLKATALPDLSGYQIAGVMSHLACADEPEHFANVEQLKTFRAVRKVFPTALASFANSSGIFLGPQYHFDLLRPGIALYGGNPTPAQPNPMQTVAHLYAPILQLREIAAGEAVGYGGSWQADRPSRIATIEAGYSEGLHRALFARGSAYIGDHKVPIIGRISMDLITLDVTDIPLPLPGTCVELLGQHQSADDLASACATISYEVLTSLKPRPGRHYI